MPKPYQPPRVKQISLGDFLVAVILLAVAIGLIRIMAPPFEPIVPALWGALAAFSSAMTIFIARLGLGAKVQTGRLIGLGVAFATLITVFFVVVVAPLLIYF